jgi:16S rRNA (cytidine1402-2'-O)-methyltransferase
MTPSNTKEPGPGRLFLVPNTLDLGTSVEPAALPDISAVLPAGVISRASQLRHWIAENAKSTRLFLKRVDALCPLGAPLQDIAIEELPRPPKGQRKDQSATSNEAEHKRLLAPALAGHDVGLISEAGLPGVADPGAAVVKMAHQLGIPVVPLSGPSSLVLAVAASGLNGQSFAFVGYLPVERNERAQRLHELEQLSRRANQTQLVIETPYRNAALLSALTEHLHERTWLSVSCGLTLDCGFTRSDTVAKWRARPTSLPDNIPAVFAFLAS